MVNNGHKIGNVISQLRKENGWTQSELAEMLQVTDKAISKWESNKGDPSIEFLPKLAELFGVTIDYLMTGAKQEEKIVAIGKMELAAKKDDPKILEGKSYAFTKDENGKTIVDYILQYKSIKLLKYVVDLYKKSPQNCKEIFPEKLFPTNRALYNDNLNLDLLFMLIDIDREILVYKSIFGIEINQLSVVGEKMSNGYINISLPHSTWKLIAEYLIVNYDKLSVSQKEYYFDINGEGGLLKKNCWAEMYPLFIDIASEKNKKILLNLIDRIEQGNTYYTSFLDELKKKNPGYMSWRCLERDQADWLKAKYVLIYPLGSTVLNLIGNEEYDLAERVNKNLKTKVEKYVFEHAKIKNNKKLSDAEKQELLCVRNGILDINKLYALNDLNFIKKLLDKYPISVYELLLNWLEKKNYKEIYRFAIDNDLRGIAGYIKYGEYDDLKRKIMSEKLDDVERKIMCGELDGCGKDNYTHIKEFNKPKMCKNEVRPYEGLYDFTGIMSNVKSAIYYDLSMKFDKAIISEGLNREFFENELAKGNTDIVIVKLCVKLESILKCDYKYVGTFEEMLNKFCSTFNTYDDEGNDYDPYTPNLLNRLRMKRNNIVHSEVNDVNLSMKDIEECIDLICKWDKEN